MNEDALRELCPLAALGVLDGTDRLAFAAFSSEHSAVGRDLAAFERLVGLMGVATLAVPPSAGLRARVLAEANPAPGSEAADRSAATGARGPLPLARANDGTSLRPSGGFALPARPWRTWLPLAAAASLAIVALAWRAQRDEVLRQVARTAAEAETLTAQNRDLRQRLEATQGRLDEAVAFRALVAHPGSRVAGLAGLPAAPAARGRVVWNADRREAVLLASGLPPAPAGKTYEAWVIAGGAPVAAGVFRADEEGRAIHPLPRLDDVARAKTFAVTIEPEAGTSAPTGPMVLAGPAL